MTKANWLLIVLISLSFLTHFMFLNYPSEVVFDEYYFGRFASDYLTKTSYFDIHPPLGKMILAGAGEIFNIKTNCTFEKIGYPCSSDIFLALRFLPALFGTLLILLFYALIKLLITSDTTALIGGFLLLFENSILVQSRHILIDIFLLFFGLLGVYLYFRAEKSITKNKKYLLYILSGLSLGACVSIKWTGIGFCIIILFSMMLRMADKKLNFKKFFTFGCLIAIPIITIYLAQFWIHFQLLPSGGEIDAFLGKNFQELSFPEKILGINRAMLNANQNIASSSHPASSKFYQWPLMYKPITYWSEESNENNAQINLFGNPVIWGLSSLGILILVFSIFFETLRREIYSSDFIAFFLLTSFIFPLLPFVFISRSTFLYHYFPSYLFAILNLSIILNWIYKHNKKFLWIIISIIIMGFIMVLPRTFGVSFDFWL
ncbi:MAG: phospholipid carrier-dependent glycosyltransferase [Candidatus Parcubacteria bacterium]|nr:phospholipid carrier-dependent glycosyltransferase [Candidatus Parcubacteria bacterium]